MKKFIFIFLSSIVLFGCHEEDAQPTVVDKVKYQLDYVEYLGDKTTMTYDNNGRISLAKYSGNSKPDIIDFLYLTGGDVQGSYNGQKPVNLKNNDLLKNGGHFVYSKTIVNGNPVELKVVRKVLKYSPSQGSYHEWQPFTIKVTYDNKINPVYLVLDQSGMIPTIDDLIFNSPDPIYSSLEAKGLVARNNATIVKAYDSSNQLVSAFTITYQYNSDDLPTTGVATDSKTNATYTMTFFYRAKP